ncbi:MAG: hypothetical protein KJO12_05640 [Ignavibacteria bacterium]|nr:hypothetical protein [Ignavibacteria bacterium]
MEHEQLIDDICDEFDNAFENMVIDSFDDFTKRRVNVVVAGILGYYTNTKIIEYFEIEFLSDDYLSIIIKIGINSEKHNEVGIKYTFTEEEQNVS